VALRLRFRREYRLAPGETLPPLRLRRRTGLRLIEREDLEDLDDERDRV